MFFHLLCCLISQLRIGESLQVPPKPHIALRSTNLCLKERNDDKASKGTDTPSSLSDEDIDFDWKAIAEYVFDESVDSTQTIDISELKDANQEIDEVPSSENPTPHDHSKPIILFDGVCNLCNGGVNFAIDHDKEGKFRFASLQSNVAKSLLIRDGKDPCTTSDIVLVTPEKNYYSSEAVARIMSGLDMPALKLLGLVGKVSPSFVRNAIYRVVSGNRFILGENDSCRMDFDGEYTSRFVSDPPQMKGEN